MTFLCTGTGENSKLIRQVVKNTAAVERWRNCSVLVIDEISMLDRHLFELLDEIARTVRGNDLPFGGIQLLAVGDFMQLPPVRQNLENPYCFQSTLWEAAGLKVRKGTIHLKKVERQNDPVFIKHLNEVRLGVLTPEFLKLLDGCVVTNKPLPRNGIIPTKLYAINKEVDSENTARLQELPGEVVTLLADDMWKVRPLKASLVPGMKLTVENMIPERIDLKIGAQVMLLRNRNFNKFSGDRNAPPLVNGSRGKVVGFSESSLRPGHIIPTVQFDNGVTTSVGPVDYECKGTGGDGVLVRQQIPLKLAW